MTKAIPVAEEKGPRRARDLAPMRDAYLCGTKDGICVVDVYMLG